MQMYPPPQSDLKKRNTLVRLSLFGEVKNYFGTISLTAQLKDFVLWSQLNGFQMHLYTNSTSFTGPLQQLIDSGVIQVFPIG